MTEKLPVQAPAKTATVLEATAAIEALYSDKPKLHKLQQYAKFRLEGIGRAAEGYEPEDLLSEAVTRTLEGDRKWNKTAVDMVGHLIGVMKSLSSHMAESVGIRKVSTYLESEVTQVTEGGDVVNPVEHRGGPLCLDRTLHSLSGASRCSDYAAVSRVVRLSQYTCSGVLPSSALCGLCWL